VNHGFIDSFAAVNENPESHPPWHWPTKYGNAALRIDFVFHTPSVSTIASRVIRTEGSDHYLLLSELVDHGHGSGNGEPVSDPIGTTRRPR